MNLRRKSVLLAVSLCCFSLGLSSLQATVVVSISGDSGTGSYRDAIDLINSGSTSPISINASIDPSLTTNIGVLTESVAIEAVDAGTSIKGNNNAVMRIELSTVTASFSSDITFETAEISIGEGTVQFNGASNLTGVTGVQLSGEAPILQFSGTASGTFASPISLAGTSNILKVDSSLTITSTGGISGALLEKQGSGTLVLPIANVYGGGTALTSGTIEIENNTSLGAGTVTFQSGSILSMASGLFVSNVMTLEGTTQTITVPTGVATITGAISGGGALVVTGPGTLTLTANNGYTGTTTISSGTLALTGATGTIEASTAVTILTGATLDISGITDPSRAIQTLSGDGSIVLGIKTLGVIQLLDGSFSGVIGVGGTAGGLTMNSDSTNALILSGVNLYTGGTDINGGTLSLSGLGSIAASSEVTVIGTFDISATTTGATVNNISGSGDVVLGVKALTVVQTEDLNLSGEISGVTGSLTLDATSTATLTLGGINTYTGTTTIAGGTLALDDTGSIEDSSSVVVSGVFDISEVTTGATIQNLSGAGVIVLGTKTLSVIQTTPGTFSGAIGPTAGDFVLDSASTSTLTFTGTNLYTGATDIEAGTLVLTGTGSIATSSAVAVDGVFDISGTSAGALIQSLSGTGSIVLGSQELSVQQKANGVFSGVISGASGSLALHVDSTHILALEGVCTYTGPTAIDSGVLALVDSGSIAFSSSVRVDGVLNISETASGTRIRYLSGEGYIILGGKTLTIEQATTGTFSGMILGKIGGITKTGVGSLTLTGDNSFEGLTTISTGTLVGVADSFPSNISNSGALIFDQSTDGIFPHAITGTGTVEKKGSGAVTLSGISNYTGVTVVTEGAFIVTGFIPTSSITVGIGGTVGGTGTVGPLDIFGTASPGTSSGLLTVVGDVIFETGSVFDITFDERGVSKMLSSGTGVIDSGVSVEVDYQRGSLPFTDIARPIFNVSSLTGTFDALTINSSWFSGTLDYTADTVFLTLTFNGFAGQGFNGNSQSVAVAIDAVVASGNRALDGVVDSLLTLTDSEISAALNQMQPALYKGQIITQESNIQRVQESLSTRLQNELDVARCLPEGCNAHSNTFHFWFDAFGDSLSQDAENYAESPQFGYSSNMFGAVLGFDGRFCQKFYAGAFGGYTDTSMHYVGNYGKGKIHSGYGGLYLSFLSDRFYVNGDMIFSFSNYNGDRNIRYTGVDAIASNWHGGTQLLSHLDAGLDFNVYGVTVRPFDSLGYLIQRDEGYTEGGAGAFNLTVEGENSSLLRNELGLQFVYCLSLCKTNWTLSPKISWVKEVRLTGAHITSSFVNTDEKFEVTGYFKNQDLISPGFILSGRMWEDFLSLDLYYTGEFRGGYSNHSYGGQIRFGY
jgi:fibronectin-binding autotransporter adhesin